MASAPCRSAGAGVRDPVHEVGQGRVPLPGRRHQRLDRGREAGDVVRERQADVQPAVEERRASAAFRARARPAPSSHRLARVGDDLEGHRLQVHDHDEAERGRRRAGDGSEVPGGGGAGGGAVGAASSLSRPPPAVTNRANSRRCGLPSSYTAISSGRRSVTRCPSLSVAIRSMTTRSALAPKTGGFWGAADEGARRVSATASGSSRETLTGGLGARGGAARG